jgi:Na+/H+ antiporter NhaD/arsenite permease-like protein
MLSIPLALVALSPHPELAGDAAQSAVPLGVTLLFAGVLVGLILCLAFEEQLHAKKSVIAGGFAATSLLLATGFGLLPFGPVIVGGHELDLPIYVPAIEWNVIAIILGSSLFVDITSRSGLFTWIAIKLTKSSGGDPRRLLWLYGLMTVVFSAVLNNVTAMIIVGSLTAVSLGKLERKGLLPAFLLVEGLLTNIGGLLTLISSVPNIIIGTTAGISFGRFFLQASPYVAMATALTLWLGVRRFKIPALTTSEERDRAKEQVGAFNESDGVSSKSAFWFGAVSLAAFIAVIAGASVLPLIDELGMGFVALLFAAIALLRYRSEADKFYRDLDWDLLGFFCGLFVVINVMEHAAVLDLVGEGLAHVIALGETTGSSLLLATSAVASSVTDNIPLAAMLASILGSDPAIAANSGSPFWWSVVFGANLGGNLTPIGSASTLVAVTVMHKHDIPLSFVGFVKLALPFAILQIILAVGWLLLLGALFGGG